MEHTVLGKIVHKHFYSWITLLSVRNSYFLDWQCFISCQTGPADSKSRGLDDRIMERSETWDWKSLFLSLERKQAEEVKRRISLEEGGMC